MERSLHAFSPVGSMKTAIERWVDRVFGAGLGAALFRGASVFLAISVVGTGLAFGLHVVLARVLGPDGYGHYAYATNLLAILILGSSLGFEHASIRFVSQYSSSQEWGRLRGFYQSTARSMMTGSGLMMILILGGTEYAQSAFGLEEERADSLRALALLVPATSFAAVWASRLRGLKAISASQVPTAIVQPILFALGIITLSALWPQRVGAPMALVVSSAAALVSLSTSAFFLHRLRRPEQQSVRPVFERKEWRSVANAFLLVSVAQIARHRSIILILGAYHSAAEIGFYASASRVASLAIFGLTAVAAWAAPLIAQYYSAGQFDRLQQVATSAARFTFPFSLATTFVIWLLGKEILGLFGPEFESGYMPLLVIALGQMVNGLTGPVGYLLTMTGNQATSARIEGATAVLAIAACLVLVPSHGLLGAALADAIANVVRNAALFIAVWKKLGVRSAIL